MDCDLCPIKQECESEKERIMNQTTNQWSNHVWGAIEGCPLVKQMKENLARSRVLTIETQGEWDE